MMLEMVGALAPLLDLLQQVQVEPPANLVAFQWVAISALAGVVAYLYRQLASRYDKSIEMLEKQYAVASETAEAIRDVTEAIRSLERAIDLDGSLRDALSARDRRQE